MTSARPITLNAGGGVVDTLFYNVVLTGAIGGAGGLTKVGDRGARPRGGRHLRRRHDGRRGGPCAWTPTASCPPGGPSRC